MSDAFDFSKFLANAGSPDDETKNAMLRDAVSDEMDTAMGEVAPRIWCVIQEQMLKDPHNNIYLNAVMNSAIFALLGWVCAVTPRAGRDGTDNDATIRAKILSNLDNALANSRDAGAQMSMIGYNVGKLKLMEDANAGLANILVTNSMVIRGIHSHIEGKSKG